MLTEGSVASNPQLVKILERLNLLPSEVLQGLASRAKTLQEWLGQVAVDDGLLTYDEIARAMARDLRMQLADLTEDADPRALDRVPAETCRSHGAVPVDFDGEHMTVAMANPLDDTSQALLSSVARCKVHVKVAPLDKILEMIDIWYANLAKDSVEPVDPFAPKPNAMPLSQAIDLSTMFDDPEEIPLDHLLIMMMENGASDLHLATGTPPVMRVDGDLHLMPFPVMTPRAIQIMVYSILTDVQITTFERHWELDFAYSVPGVSRFRVNLHRQRGSIGAVFRTIPTEIPTLDKLYMPSIVRELTMRPRGLVLVTGPTGSGKSTTLAAMVEEINRNRPAHIVTIEDPIEFVHSNRMCVITQREVGSDTESFATALRHVLRQDPDVILVGEMRDLETIATAVTAAETGHLVFATLHTTSAAQTIERIIDVFPPYQQEQIRSQLSNTLEGIISQTLLINQDGKGRSCAQEILIATPAVRNLIREGKVHQMASVIQASAKYGMQTLDQSLKQLVLGRRVTLEEASKKASNPEDFKSLVAME